MPLDIGILLLNRGAGGNFLARILTLDPATVCLSAQNIDTTDGRCKLYHYDSIKLSPHEFSLPATDGLSKWVSYELFEMYFPLSRGIENLSDLNLKVIEPIHPNHLIDKLNLLGPDDNVKIAIIENDELTWTYNQVLHKINKDVSKQQFDEIINMENKLIDNYKKVHLCFSIKLSDIIGSQTKFIDTYHQLCNFFDVKFYDEYATKIRNSWKKTWAFNQ